MADAERKGLRIPVVSDVAGALKNTADLKGALQATVGGAEVAALLYAFSMPESIEKMALGGAVLGTSIAILALIRESHHNKK
jgi:hypothetical protein